MVDSYIRYGIIAAGVLCIMISLLDPKYLIKMLFNRKNNEVKDATTLTNKENGFLEIVSLWYQLKSKCDTYKLTSASEKLDEVFPLLNKVLDNET